MTWNHQFSSSQREAMGYNGVDSEEEIVTCGIKLLKISTTEQIGELFTKNLINQVLNISGIQWISNKLYQIPMSRNTGKTANPVSSR